VKSSRLRVSYDPNGAKVAWVRDHWLTSHDSNTLTRPA